MIDIAIVCQLHYNGGEKYAQLFICDLNLMCIGEN